MVLMERPFGRRSSMGCASTVCSAPGLGAIGLWCWRDAREPRAGVFSAANARFSPILHVHRRPLPTAPGQRPRTCSRQWTLSDRKRPTVDVWCGNQASRQRDGEERSYARSLSAVSPATVCRPALRNADMHCCADSLEDACKKHSRSAARPPARSVSCAATARFANAIAFGG